MSVVFATLLVIVVSVVPPLDNTSVMVEPVTLDAEKVVILAGTASAQASLLDGERHALGCELDRENSAECAQVGLIQSVLKDLAADRRDESAADALDAFYRIVALEQQRDLLTQSSEMLQSLLKMAEQAEELDLPDGDASELRLKHLDIREQLIVVRFGIRKLQRRLADAIDWPLPQVESAILNSTLSRDSSPTDQTAAFSLALANRGDYLATLTLCRCMNADSLPAAKSIMGVLQPGVGLAISKGPTALLAKLAHHNDSASDLACRRRQCHSLTEASRDLIEQQIAHAILNFDEANERLSLAKEIEQSTIENTLRKTSAEKIDKAPAGAQKLASLTEFKRRADRIDRERDLALCEVQLRRVTGTLFSE